MPRGGPRKGAGRKPGLRAARPKESKSITLMPELWQRLDAVLIERGITRTDAITLALEDWLAKAWPKDSPK